MWTRVLWDLLDWFGGPGSRCSNWQSAAHKPDDTFLTNRQSVLQWHASGQGGLGVGPRCHNLIGWRGEAFDRDAERNDGGGEGVGWGINGVASVYFLALVGVFCLVFSKFHHQMIQSRLLVPNPFMNILPLLSARCRPFYRFKTIR